MISFDKLHVQNHKITELSNVLLHLFDDRSMCDTETACDLLFLYLEKLDKHLTVVDHLYPTLLIDHDKQVKHVANNFLSGEQEIRKFIAKYMKTWCKRKKHELVIHDYAGFLEDTQGLFHMVLNRIQDETEHLYPLVRQKRAHKKDKRHK